MNDLAGREYVALRDTIRTRAGARPWVFLAGFSAWAVTLVAVLSWLPNPVGALVPLLVLVASFEVVRMLHLTVERVGRYVQVFFEERGSSGRALEPPAWERTAMALGPSLPGAGGHPFFLPLFLLATLVNLLAVVLPGPVPVEVGTLAVPHVAFVVWMLTCDRAMRRQRTTDLSRFRALRTPPAAQ